MVVKEQILAHVRGRCFRSLVELLINKKCHTVSQGKRKLEERLQKLEERLKEAGIRVKFLRRWTTYFFFVCDEPWLSVFEELEEIGKKAKNLYFKFCTLLVDIDYKRREKLINTVGSTLFELSCAAQAALNAVAEAYRRWVVNKDEEALQAAMGRYSEVLELWRQASDIVENEERLALPVL